jgi:hypothetical protein
MRDIIPEKISWWAYPEAKAARLAELAASRYA